MIVLTNTSDQTVSSGEIITFNSVVHQSGTAERYRMNTGTVKLVNGGIYEVHFNGNITGDTAGTGLEVAITIGGAKLLETEMVYTPATADAVGEISATTIVKNCCGDYDSIAVENIGDADISVSDGCCLFIKRIA